MKLIDFIKDKILNIVLILFAILTIEAFLCVYNFGAIIKIYIPVSIFLAYMIGIMIEFYCKKRYYQEVINKVDELDQKYLITEIIPKASFLEGKIFDGIVKDIDKAMLENVNYYKHLQEEYKEYIELWIHEVKIPIATSKLIIENNKNETMKSINEELDKIEDYTEQALFYARSNTLEKDYYIRKNKLEDIVNECIRKNKNILIQEKVSMDVHDLDVIINTDSKWIVFILNQIIQNSIKYRKNNTKAKIEIYAKLGKENVILYIKDNGIGIKKGEITRVFDKGFTGTNGRLLNKKSTGIGLYLCKKLCSKLGIAIELNSKQDEGTEIRLVFPQNSYTNL